MVAHDNRHVFFDIGHRHAARGVTRSAQGARFYRDGTIHLLLLDRVPAVAEADFGAMIGRAVKAFRKSATDVGDLEPTIVAGGWRGPMVGNLGKNLL